MPTCSSIGKTESTFRRSDTAAALSALTIHYLRAISTILIHIFYIGIFGHVFALTACDEKEKHQERHGASRSFISIINTYSLEARIFAKLSPLSVECV